MIFPAKLFSDSSMGGFNPFETSQTGSLAQINVNTKRLNHHLAANRLIFTHQPRQPLPQEQPETYLNFLLKKNNNFLQMCLCFMEVKPKERSVTWLPLSNRNKTPTPKNNVRDSKMPSSWCASSCSPAKRWRFGSSLGGDFGWLFPLIWSLMSFDIYTEIYHYSAVSNKVLDRGPCKVQITKFLWQLCMIVYFSRGDRIWMNSHTLCCQRHMTVAKNIWPQPWWLD